MKDRSGKMRALGTFRTKQEADAALSHARTDMDRGRRLFHEGETIRFSDYAEHWIKNHPKGLAATTLELYEQLYRTHIEQAFGAYMLAQISSYLVDNWFAELGRSTGPAAQANAYKLLRAVLTTAVKHELIPKSPCRVKNGGAPSLPERPLMSLDDMERLAAAMPDNLRCAVVITFWAHLRKGELLALRRSDVDLERRTLRVERSIVRTKQGPKEKGTKTEVCRTVHLPTQAVGDLRRHLALAPPGLPSAPLFWHESGSELRRHHLDYAWKRARRDLELTEFRFHDLRHAGLTYVAQWGASLRLLQQRAGHKTVAAAMNYQRYAESHDRDLADRMSDSLTAARVVAPGSDHGTSMAHGSESAR